MASVLQLDDRPRVEHPGRAIPHLYFRHADSVNKLENTTGDGAVSYRFYGSLINRGRRHIMPFCGSVLDTSADFGTPHGQVALGTASVTLGGLDLHVRLWL